MRSLGTSTLGVILNFTCLQTDGSEGLSHLRRVLRPSSRRNWNRLSSVRLALLRGQHAFIWIPLAGKPIPHDPVWGTFKDGKIHDERNIQHSVRCRRFANRKTAAYRIKCSRRERLLQMIDEGFLFVQTHGKGRYVNFYGDRETVTTLRAALRWNVLPYPKRVSEQQMSNNQPPAAHAMCGRDRSLVVVMTTIPNCSKTQ